MKYLIVLMTSLFLVGCGGEEEALKEQVSGLKGTVSSLRDQLNVCESSLSTYRNSSSSSSLEVEETTEEAESKESSCEFTELSELYVDGKYLTKCETVSVAECGINASDCDDGFAYACLKSVKYKTIEKEICK